MNELPRRTAAGDRGVPGVLGTDRVMGVVAEITYELCIIRYCALYAAIGLTVWFALDVVWNIL